MRKLFLLLTIVGFVSFSLTLKAQLMDEKNVTITMDLQPILQLNMTTPDQIDFVFDKITEYSGGIIKYGATTLKVSSSVPWDLYAVGTSTQGTLFWDVQANYGLGNANASNLIPLSALELHQNNINKCTVGGEDDYSRIFSLAPVAGSKTNNSIFESTTPYSPPGVADKYLQGYSGVDAGAGEGAAAGSYLTNPPAAVAGTIPVGLYYYVIDYRIKPGLPSLFPNAFKPNTTLGGIAEPIVAPKFAEPGYYTMDVKYILCEDQ
jgi:hypothetical protein